MITCAEQKTMKCCLGKELLPGGHGWLPAQWPLTQHRQLADHGAPGHLTSSPFPHPSAIIHSSGTECPHWPGTAPGTKNTEANQIGDVPALTHSLGTDKQTNKEQGHSMLREMKKIKHRAETKKKERGTGSASQTRWHMNWELTDYAPQRCQCPKPQNLWIWHLTWQKGVCRWH